MNAENMENNDCSQIDSAEHKGYAKVHRSFNSIWKERDSAQPELLEKILYKDNLNRAFKRVKANKGAPGIDGITVDEIGAYLKENQQTIIAKIYKGKYTPDAVRRVEIPKPDDGVRKLGIPTVKDRIFQQYIAVVDVKRYASDMECFVPLMEKFNCIYGHYPKYPVADAGYGSYNNYLYCEHHGMEKFMKFTMFKKETSDKKYHHDPYRAVNFQRDEYGNITCPNGRKFIFKYRKHVYKNKYGKTEEIYECENCEGCPIKRIAVKRLLGTERYA